MSLKVEIQLWDGKSAADIKAIYDNHFSEVHFIDSTLSLLNDETIQTGASWLLKEWLSQNNQLNHKQTAVIFDNLLALKSWESKLHILQCLPFITIDTQHKAGTEHFLRLTLTDNNKFVRAWSYNGFYELAKHHNEYKDEAKQLFEMAMRDEAASVKARIRNILKTGF